ncbi:MAG: tripartite tricarboxylate transporter substrate binding protein [Burkholderiales bacterium]
MASLATAVLAVVLVLAAMPSAAQTFPSRPIRLIVPYAPGGSPDTLARVLGQAVGESFGQQVIIENRPGGAGIPAAEAVMRATPDGYTLLVADSSVYAITPNVRAKPPFDPLRDFIPISHSVNSPLLLVVNAGLPVQTFREFLAYAKAKPGLAFGSSGNATAHHLAMEMLRTLGGLEFTHVPYKGAGQSVPAVVAGDVAALFAAIPAVGGHAKAGKVRILGIFSPTRSPSAPDIATLSEAGLPGCELTITIGFHAPARTPPEIVTRLSDQFVRAMKVPAVRERMGNLQFDLVGTGAEAYAETIRGELLSYGKLIKAAGVRVD